MFEKHVIIDAPRKSYAEGWAVECGYELENGSTFIDLGGKYELDSERKNAVFVGPEKKKAESLVIRDAVKIGWKTYKVTQVKAGACKGMTKLKELSIGKNVKTIGDEAFSGCKKAKKLTIYGTSLKKVGKNAFDGWKKVTVSAKKKVLDKYVKLLVKAGMSGKIIEKVLK